MSEHQHTEQRNSRFTLDAAVCFPALILLFGAIAMVLLIPEAGSNPFRGCSGGDC